MSKRRLSKLRLLVELRKLLSRPDTKVVERKQKVCGHSTAIYEDSTSPPTVSNICIYLDSRRDGRVRLVIHELLHIYIRQHFRIDQFMVYELEEEAILAWERKLYSWLHDAKHTDALESWNQAIERKMR